MQSVTVDREAMRFRRGNMGVNVFWQDTIGRRGFRFFLHQLMSGIRLITG